MKLEIDLDTGSVHTIDGDTALPLDLTTPEAFRLMTRAWLRATWEAKYIYSMTWMGRPIIQLPDDLLRLQELVVAQRPDVILETGIAHGGSLIFNASLLKALGHGHVIGIDIDIRAHNRAAIEAHQMYQEGLITMYEGSSIDPDVAAQVIEQIGPQANVLVVLDANHTKQHVLRELETYSPLVPVGGYIVASDGGIMAEMAGGPRTSDDWGWNNPQDAAREFVESHPDFVLSRPDIPFNEGTAVDYVSYFGNGYIRRIA